MSRWSRRGIAMAVALGIACLSAGARAAGHEPEPSAEAALLHARSIVERYKNRFRVVDDKVADGLGELYGEDIVLEDPITRVEGLAALRGYLQKFAEQSEGARFEMRGEIIEADQAAVFWTMVFSSDGDDESHRFDGVSHLRFDDRIREQRDYFDLGAAVYERVPILGWLTNLVDKRLAPESHEEE